MLKIATLIADKHKLLFALLPFACLSLPRAARAQRVIYQSTIPRLQTKIRLGLGATTAKQAMDALSAQTGLKIETAAYLRERRLDVELDDVTCRAALDALSELNEWRWEEIGEGHILLTRHIPPVPQKMTEVAPAMIAALPRDWRAYLYIDIPWQEVKLASGTTSTRFGPTYVHDAMGIRSSRLINRMGDAILDTMQPPLKNGDKRPYAQMTAVQRDALTAALFARALNDTNFDLLHNRYKLYQLDFARSTIEINGVGFLIGTHTQDEDAMHFDFFGFEMGGRHTLPEPSPLDTLAPLPQP